MVDFWRVWDWFKHNLFNHDGYTRIILFYNLDLMTTDSGRPMRARSDVNTDIKLESILSQSFSYFEDAV